MSTQRITERMIRQQAARLKVQVEVSKPGDGRARYHFQVGGRETLATGAYPAWMFLQGIETGQRE